MIKISKTIKEYHENDVPFSRFTPEIIFRDGDINMMGYQQINHNLSSPYSYWIETCDGFIKEQM